MKKHYLTGEINFHTEKKDEIIRTIKSNYSDGNISELDGLTVEYNDWWFNIRKSNTEPLLRLIVEAEKKELLEKKLGEIKKIIESFL